MFRSDTEPEEFCCAFEYQRTDTRKQVRFERSLHDMAGNVWHSHEVSLNLCSDYEQYCLLRCGAFYGFVVEFQTTQCHISDHFLCCYGGLWNGRPCSLPKPAFTFRAHSKVKLSPLQTVGACGVLKRRRSHLF
jgi:hypothetical protein